jgi:hypothetical protein
VNATTGTGTSANRYGLILPRFAEHYLSGRLSKKSCPAAVPVIVIRVLHVDVLDDLSAVESAQTY